MKKYSLILNTSKSILAKEKSESDIVKMEQSTETRKNVLNDLKNKIAEIEKQPPKEGTLIQFFYNF